MPGKNYVIAILVEASDKNVAQVLGGVEDDIEGVGTAGQKAGSKLQSAFTGAAMAMAFGQAIPLMKTSIGLFNEMRSGLVGLQAIVRYTGEDWNNAKAQLTDYTNDGLIPFSQATKALKNLLLRGYGLEKSIELLRRLKDAAAYGRQGQLSMGEAIVSATEGLKNENSILVDNAGVTRNVSKMWEDYAKAHGLKRTEMTDSMKTEAEYAGIMRETAPMVGNAIDLQGELSGQMAATEAKTRRLKEAIGGALAPAYADLLTKASPVLETIIAFTQENPKTIATLLGGAGLVAAVAALATAFALMGPGGAIVVAITAAVIGLGAAIAHFKTKLTPTTEEIVASAEKHGALGREIEGLRDEYEELAGKPDKSAEEHERLDRVMQALKEHVPEAAQAFNEEGRVIELNLSALDNYIAAKEILRQYYVELLEDRQSEANRRLASTNRDLALALGAYNETQGETIQTTRENIDTQEDFASAAAGVTANIHDMRMQEVYAAMSADELKEVIANLAMEVADADIEAKQITEHLKNLKGETDEVAAGATDAAGEVDKVTKSFVDWNEQLEYFRFLYGALIPVMDEIPGQMGEMAQYMQDYWQQHEQAAEDAEAAQRDYGEEVKRSMSRWGDWVDFTIQGLDMTADTLTTAVGIMTGAIDGGTDVWRQIFEDFFSWLWMMIIKTIIKMLIMKAVMAMFGGGGGGGLISDDIIGEVTSGDMARHGGMIRGTVPSIDSVWIRGMPGELVTSVPLTRRLENLVADWESGRIPSGGRGSSVLAEADGGTVEEHIHFHTNDYNSWRRSIRNGPLGREMRIAQRHGRF